MRRTAGMVLGLSVAGCQGFPLVQQAQGPNEVVAHLVTMPATAGAGPAGYGPMAPPAPPAFAPQPAQVGPAGQNYLPPNGAANAPPAAPGQYREPPLVGPGSAMMPDQLIPGVVLARGPGGELRYVVADAGRPLATQAGGDDNALRTVQIDLTREMCHQIIDMKKKVLELGTQVETRAEAARAEIARVEAAQARVPSAARVDPPAEPKKIVVVAAPAKAPTPDDEAVRVLQLELTREIGNQVVDLKQKVQDLGTQADARVEASREKMAQESRAEIRDLRVQLVKMQTELVKLKTPERPHVEPIVPIADDDVIPAGVAAPPEPAPVAPPLMPRYKRPAVREGSALPLREINRRMASDMAELRQELEELKARLTEKYAVSETQPEEE